MRTLDIRPAAIRDLLAHADHLSRDSPGAADRLLVNARITAVDLTQFPFRGRARPELSTPRRRLRSIPVRDFPNHLLLYKVTSKSVVVLRLVHGAQDLPRYLRLA